MSFFKDEADDFWDVSKLVPKKSGYVSRFSTSQKIVDVTVDADEPRDKHSDGRKLDFSAYRVQTGDASGAKERSYSPEWSKLIKRVTIKPSIDRFDFYDTFRKAALIYFDYKCPKCEFVPFYSYMPQYIQMTPEQKRYYFYWRDEVRRGRYIKVDYSYIYLYVYEILNLPEKISSSEGIKLLCSVWRAYRGELPMLDNKFSLWVQDYCLIYGLNCPIEEIKDFLIDVINASSFKEFYLSDVGRGENCASSMIAYLSDYDWRRGRCAGGKNAEAYRMHIEGAMGGIFTSLFEGNAPTDGEIAKITRGAFQGCLCTHSVKSNLDIEYYSIASSPKLRADVTAALKYVENKLRACLGVKSRLMVKDLPDEFKDIIDKYFEVEFRRRKREKERANAPEYERLYISETTDASFEDAIEIEKASWKTTAKLIEGLEEQESDDELQPDEIIERTDSADTAADERYGLGAVEIAFLDATLRLDAEAQKTVLAEASYDANFVAERINEAFADNFGDVILEDDGNGGFKVIDDYYEEIKEWIR